MVERLFLAVPWGCLRFVIVVFPDHTHLLFRTYYHFDGETIVFFETFFWRFYGQSFIKTVRGPFIVPSVVYYQDGKQISIYLTFIFDKLILIAPAIMHLKMVSATFIRDMQQTPFKMHHCMQILHVHVLTILTYASCRRSLIISAIKKSRCYLL